MAMKNLIILKQIKIKYAKIKLCFNEKSRRIWAASEARLFGRGGITLLSGWAKIN